MTTSRRITAPLLVSRNSSRIAKLLCSLAIAMLPVTSEAQLEVTLDSGLGTQVFTDGDSDGTVDFDTTVSGVFQAQGTAKEELGALRNSVTLAPLSPNPTALFRNLSASPQTFTVTVKSSTFAAPVAAPTGWDIIYIAEVDDLVDMSVDTPSHSVAAKTSAGAITLGTVAGAALTTITDIHLEEHGADPANTASDVVLVWTFTLGANDELRVASDNGFDGDSIQVNVFNQTQKCIDKMNAGAGKVGDVAQKSDSKCLRTLASDVTTCVDDTAETRTEKQEEKLDSTYATYCDPVPAWGVNGASCCEGGTAEGSTCAANVDCTGGVCTEGACMGAAADAGAGDLAHDLHGPVVTVSADKLTARCQQHVAGTLGKLYTQRWKSFRTCTKDNFATISGDLLLKATCLSPQPDDNSKISKAVAKVTDTVQKKCLDKNVTGLGTLFPGECSSELDAAIGACLSTRASCRFCQAVNDADEIVPALDCDQFDDALANASCP